MSQMKINKKINKNSQMMGKAHRKFRVIISLKKNETEHIHKNLGFLIQVPRRTYNFLNLDFRITFFSNSSQNKDINSYFYDDTKTSRKAQKATFFYLPFKRIAYL